MIKFKNMFRGSDKKEELIPITETKEQIKKEVKEQAMALLKRIGLKIKRMCIRLHFPVDRNSVSRLSVPWL